MHIDFIKNFEGKSDIELEEYIQNRKKYNPEAVLAAVKLLRGRGRDFSIDELETIKFDIKKKIEEDNQQREIFWKPFSDKSAKKSKEPKKSAIASTIIVDKGVRFQNYLIDLLIVSTITGVLAAILNLNNLCSYLLFQSIYFLYYFLMEYKYRQTIGKKFTKTIVTDKSGNPVKTKSLIIRTAFRIAGLDSLSFLVGTNVGMHDWFSNTRVVKLILEDRSDS